MTSLSDWPLPDWKPVQPFPFCEARRAFTGPASAQAPVVIDYYQRPDRSLAAVARFRPATEGAPGHAHGGAVLTVLDEALGAAAWLAGCRVMTVKLATDFRRAVPLGATMLVETRITARRHRMVFVEGEMRGPDAALYAAARGSFLELSPGAHLRIFGRPS
ncbi:MAG: PaaI family thioesterase [Elusimicrobia bacterium]|nr:PaaI family thioesterase [Elusimicrobiota bacterium]